MTTRDGADDRVRRGTGTGGRDRDSHRDPDRDSERGPGTSGLVAEVWVRCVADPASGRTNAALARLETLRAAGRLDDVVVRTWDNAIDRSSASTADGDESVAFARYDAWASANGVRLAVSPPTTAGRGRMGPEYLTQSSPWLLVAIRRDGELIDVAPTAIGRRRRSVGDLLDALSESGPEPAPVDEFDDPLESLGADARPTRRRWGPVARRRFRHDRYSARSA
jgi:hypothetical protein